MTDEELDQMTRIDVSNLELSNEDVIIAKPGTVVRKTWRITNTFNEHWPDDT